MLNDISSNISDSEPERIRSERINLVLTQKTQNWRLALKDFLWRKQKVARSFKNNRTERPTRQKRREPAQKCSLSLWWTIKVRDPLQTLLQSSLWGPQSSSGRSREAAPRALSPKLWKITFDTGRFFPGSAASKRRLSNRAYRCLKKFGTISEKEKRRRGAPHQNFVKQRNDLRRTRVSSSSGTSEFGLGSSLKTSSEFISDEHQPEIKMRLNWTAVIDWNESVRIKY